MTTQEKAIDVIRKAVLAWMSWYQDMGVEGFKKVSTPAGPSPGGFSPGHPGLHLGIGSKPLTGMTLEAVRKELGDCTRCKLSSGRTHIVFGSGNPKAKLMFVGEGPGEEEDRQGLPFVGRAGQLLTKMITAMGLSREEVYIANIVKCRPPNNRPPQPDEISSCQPFLIKQIETIHPKIVCALGTFAAQTLLSTKVRISDLRGQFHDFHGIKVLPTFHPAYLLRNPGEKKKAWEDLQKIMQEL